MERHFPIKSSQPIEMAVVILNSFTEFPYYSGKAARGKFSVAFFFVIFRVAIGYARMRSASINFSG